MRRFGARTAAESIFVVHTALMALLLFGWLLSPPYYYLYVAALWVTFLTQVTFRYCLLTPWEFYFRRILDPSVGSPPNYLTFYLYRVSPGFVTDEFVDRISLVFLSVSIVISMLHLLAGVV